MPVSRRDFIKLSGMTVAGAFVGGTSFLSGCKSVDKLSGTKESTTICPYCGVGCGLIVAVKGGKIVNIEGDPDHPINQGSLCSKGSALYQVAVNQRRLEKIQYRKPYGTEWEEISWDEAAKRIARRVKETRDSTYQEKDGGYRKPGGSGPRQRGMLCPHQVRANAWNHLSGTPGPYLTLRYSRRSGGFIRPGRHDKPLD
jgi:formate dehydrogenase major subunit